MTLKQFGEAVTVDMFTRDINSLIEADGRADLVKAIINSETSPSNTIVGKNLKIDGLGNNIDFLKELPIKSLKAIYDKYGGRVVIIASDFTGVGYDKNGVAINGGVRYLQIEENIDNKVVFAFLDETKARALLTRISNNYEVGDKIAVLIMLQKPTSTLGNAHGSQFLFRAVKSIMSNKDISTSAKNQFMQDLKSLSIGTDFANFEDLFDNISNLDEYETSNQVINRVIDVKKGKDSRSSFGGRRKLLEKIFRLDSNNIKESKVNKARLNVLNTLESNGYTGREFLKEFGDPSFLNESIINEDKGGFVVAGFEHEVLNEYPTVNGIPHSTFNGALPSTSNERFLLDGMYSVNENISDIAVQESTISKDPEAQKYLKNVIKKVTGKNQEYSKVSVTNSIKVKNIIKEERPEFLISKSPNVLATTGNLGATFMGRYGENVDFYKSYSDQNIKYSKEISPKKDLEGIPQIKGATGVNKELASVAEKYAIDNGIDYRRQPNYVEVDESRAKRIAAEYDKMLHLPQDPKVKEAYQNLIEQTTKQYEALVAGGYKFWFIDLNIESNAEYSSSPYNAMRDIRENKQMGVFPSTEGFGSSDLDVEDNPLLADTGLKWGTGNVDGEKKTVLANDLFRAVHDAFGHGLEGAGFRARGEENAWQAHARLFTGSALAAITSETRGQNSWLNYGKFGDTNKTAKIEDTIFADQKTGLMPEWTWTEGFEKDPLVGGANFANFFAGVTNTKNGGANFNNVAEILQKPIDGYEEELKAYLKYGGNFQKHIMASIPGFVDARIRILKAMADTSVILGEGGKQVNMLDITSSEGYFTKAYAQLAQDKGVNAKADALDAGVTFQRDFQNTPQVEGVNYLLQAWGESFTDPDSGIRIPLFMPTKKYGVVFEGMGFQFFTPTREKEISDVKSMMEKDGLFVTMQKLKNLDYASREVLKDQYKSQFFSQETLKEKAAIVLNKSDNSVGMMDFQYDRLEYEKVLAKNFKYVVQIYSSGNFAGYFATDSKEVMEKSLSSTGDTTTKFNEEATPKLVKGDIKLPLAIENVDLSKIKIEKSLTNDTFSYKAISEKGKELGRLKTKNNLGGEKIESVSVKPQFRGQGVAKSLYINATKELMKQNKVLYSSDNRQSGPDSIWKELEQNGLAEKSSDGSFKTKPMPPSLDKNGEAKVEQVVRFIQKDEVKDPLSSKEIQELKLNLTGTEFKNSGELLVALNKSFFKNGAFNPTKLSLTSIGIYSNSEIQGILTQPFLQNSIKEFIFKLENTEEEVQNDLYSDKRFMVSKEDAVPNQFGKTQVSNPFITEQEAINEVGGVETEAKLQDALQDSELNYLKGQENLFELFSKFKRISQKVIRNGELINKPKNDTFETLNQTLVGDSDGKLVKAVREIIDVREEVLLNNPKETQTVLKNIDIASASIGLDLKNFEDIYNKKDTTEIKQFLSEVLKVLESGSISEFSEVYNNFFAIENVAKEVVQEVPSKDKGKAIWSVVSKESSYNMFNEFGLLPLGNNLYQRTDSKSQTLEQAFEIAFERTKVDKTLFPSEFKTVLDLKRFVQGKSKGIDTSKLDNIDSEVLQKLALYKYLFKGELNNETTPPNIYEEQNLLEQGTKLVNEETIADFYSTLLKEKRKNSEKYKDFYSKFEITSEGISLISNDPITISSIKSQIEGYPDLKGYFNSNKNSNLTFLNEDEVEQELDENFLRGYYSNFPQALSIYTGEYQVLNSQTISTKGSNPFLRISSGIYEFNKEVSGTNYYSKLEENTSEFKDYNLNSKPMELNIKGVTNNEEAKRTDNNLYSKGEEGKIDDNLKCS
jgi:ribosomal protein S18 acetylase RimI-like enzyme